jgi:ABC-type multidrug transport system ATPase subunit
LPRSPQSWTHRPGEAKVSTPHGSRARRKRHRRPSVLIFDEGTSALDTEPETALLQALKSLRGQRTLIIVTHRLTTVENCDTVWLKRGRRLVHQGPLAELASRNPELRATKRSRPPSLQTSIRPRQGEVHTAARDAFRPESRCTPRPAFLSSISLRAVHSRRSRPNVC